MPFAVPGTVPPNPDIADANPGTFYSALSNIDFEIGKGNAGAVGIRFHGAQHDYLSHIDFHIGSGLAGLHQVANEAEDLRFFGGRYGILAEKPSPAWQFTLLDGKFEGQREAAIREHEASLTLVNASFRNVPVAIDIDPDIVRLAVGEEQPLREYRQGGRDRQQREQRLYPDRFRE